MNETSCTSIGLQQSNWSSVSSPMAEAALLLNVAANVGSWPHS